MPENSQTRLRDAICSDELTVQGLRLTNVFRKIKDVNDRLQILALAEQLLDAQEKNPK